MPFVQSGLSPEEWKKRGLTGKNVLGTNKQAVIADFESGMSAAAVARKWGVTRWAASKFKHRNIDGLYPPVPPKPLPEPLKVSGCVYNKEELYKDWKAGMPMREMVHKYGVLRGSLYKFIKKHFKPKSVPNTYELGW